MQDLSIRRRGQSGSSVGGAAVSHLAALLSSFRREATCPRSTSGSTDGFCVYVDTHPDRTEHGIMFHFSIPVFGCLGLALALTWFGNHNNNDTLVLGWSNLATLMLELSIHETSILQQSDSET